MIGLGSMGKRRVRNLLANGVEEVIGFDTRADRRAEAASSYGIRAVESREAGWDAQPGAAIISLPPHLHVEAELDSATRGVPFFVEAGVLLDGMEELISLVDRAGLVAMASCTMRYFPGPRLIKRVATNGSLGKPLAWQYQSGQYLPDWHPWEPITDYYVSRRDTGGCREIVPFELTWLVDVFGGVADIQGSHAKVSSLDADIDDIYTAELVHDSGVRGQLMVDVISRPPVRSFRLTCNEGTLEWDGVANTARTSRLGEGWRHEELQTGHAEKGYINPEEPYIAEIADFLSAVRRERPPANTLREDREILQALVALETTAAQ